MPLLGMLHLLIAIGFALHAYRNGKPQFWMVILIMVPLVGSLAYVLFELLPELAQSRRARRVATDLRTVVDPHRDWRQAREQVEQTGTVDAKLQFAEECERKGMWDDAISMYELAAQGVYAEDPDILRGLARAQLGNGDPQTALSILDRLRGNNPDYHNQDAHLTYARSLEALDRLVDAAREYGALSEYFVGLEARTRFGVLLLRLGEPAQARRLFEDVIKASKARGAVLTDQDREWVRVARANLR